MNAREVEGGQEKKPATRRYLLGRSMIQRYASKGGGKAKEKAGTRAKVK